MDIRFQAGGPEQWSADALILPLAEGETPAQASPELEEGLAWLSIAPGVRDFKGKKGELLLVYGPPAHPLSRVILCGLGSLNNLTFSETLDKIREVTGKAVVYGRKMGFASLAVPTTALARLHSDQDRVLTETACAALLALWRNNRFKSSETRSQQEEDPLWLAFLCPESSVPDNVRTSVRYGETCADAVRLARNLANAPGNALTPADFAEEAEKLSRRHAMHCEILGREELEGLGMGAFTSVAAGSANPPRLVILEYAPEGHEEEAPLVVVGKGITFDSGGICLKPAAGMWEMKGDMGGAAAVLGLFEALGRLALPRRVIGLMACAENMPDAHATRPGDVVTTLAGKTVEIVNTDAEGRLVLCDALTFAQQRWTPSLLIDVATLTGACVVALGDDVAGLFCQDATLAQHIMSLGELTGEPFWPLPLKERYFENLKSETADFANAGPRAGGASSAAMFLKQFVGAEIPWAHLDIAGPGFITKKGINCPAGATGFAVRTLIEVAKV